VRGCAFEHSLCPVPADRARATQEADGARKYAKKTLTLTVCEVLDISGRNPADVGSIVLNLAEFASAEGADNERRLPLACSAAITAAVGQPMLSCTIRCVLSAGWLQKGRGTRVLSLSRRAALLAQPALTRCALARLAGSVKWCKSGGSVAGSTAGERCAARASAHTH